MIFTGSFYIQNLKIGWTVWSSLLLCSALWKCTLKLLRLPACVIIILLTWCFKKVHDKLTLKWNRVVKVMLTVTKYMLTLQGLDCIEGSYSNRWALTELSHRNPNTLNTIQRIAKPVLLIQFSCEEKHTSANCEQSELHSHNVFSTCLLVCMQPMKTCIYFWKQNTLL